MKIDGSFRRTLVALMAGLLIGGSLMAITPAGAQVNQAVSSKWKKLWKKEIRPQADKRYYTKKQGDTKYATKAEVGAGYQPKGNYETAGSGYTKAESDAKYSAAGSAYSKAESDAKFAAKAQTVRGVFSMRMTAAGAGSLVSNPIMFGVNLAAAPQVHYVAESAVPPAPCAGGTADLPKAQPGHLCVFASMEINLSSPQIYNGSGMLGSASPFGAYLGGSSTGAGGTYWYGTWALGVSTLAAAGASVPSVESQGPVDGR